MIFVSSLCRLVRYRWRWQWRCLNGVVCYHRVTKSIVYPSIPSNCGFMVFVKFVLNSIRKGGNCVSHTHTLALLNVFDVISFLAKVSDAILPPFAQKKQIWWFMTFWFTEQSRGCAFDVNEKTFTAFSILLLNGSERAKKKTEIAKIIGWNRR